MENSTIVKDIKRRKCEIPGVRYVFAACGFLGFCVIYAIRVNINVAIVAMVNATAIYSHGNTSLNESRSDECPVPDMPFDVNGTTYRPQKEGEFIWDPQMQGVVIGAFYYGYWITQIPGGRLAEVTSGKWVYGIGILITAVLTLLTPLAARWNVGVLIFIRALEGLAQGVTMPAMLTMLGKWLPDNEKSLLAAIVHIGINIGTVAAMPMVGVLCNSDFLGGWPAAFYVIGLVGCLWFVLWFFLVTETPAEHPFISNQELKYIIMNQKRDMTQKLPPIPWKKIMKSGSVWALIITQVGQDWCFFTFLNDLPTYFATILHFEITKNGFLTAFPHLLSSIVGLAVGYIADVVVRKGKVSLGCVRKFCNTLSGICGCAAMVGICFAGCDATITIVCYMGLIGTGGLVYGSSVVYPLDISPEYAGTIIGISNTASNLAGFAAPLVVGALTNEYQTLHQWNYVFGITVLFLAVANIAFLFTSSEKQDWTSANTSYGVLKDVCEVSGKKNSIR